MTLADIIGIIAMIFSFAVYCGNAVQIRRIIKRKSSKDISKTLYFLLLGSAISWLLYGIAIKNAYIIITNTVALMMVLITLIFIFKYRK